MKKNFDVICIGGITRDYVCDTEGAVEIQKNKLNKYIAFDFGSKHPIDLQSKSFGGGALNSAITFSRVGLKVAIDSVIGNDLIGQEALYYIKKNKIDISFLQKDSRKPTAFAFIINSAVIRDHLLFVYPGANNNLQLIKTLNERNHKTKFYFVTSLSGAYADFNLEFLFSLKSKQKAQLFWNPGHQQIANILKWQRYFSAVDYFSINNEECQIILSKFKKKISVDVRQNIQILINLGLSRVLITCGEDGSYYFDGYEYYHQPIIPTKVKNTTGAGDAFNSGFLSGIIKYDGIVKKSLLLAAKNSSAILKTYGAHEGGLTKKDL